MMRSMPRCHLLAGGTDIDWTFCAMMTKTRAIVTMDGSDPLSFGNLDSNDIVFSYCGGHRGSRT